MMEKRAGAQQELIRNVLFAAAATLDSADPSEALALERRVEGDGWPSDWAPMRFLAAVGLLSAGRDVRELVVRILPDAVRSSEGRRALPLVFKIWSEGGWDDSNRLISEMLSAIKIQGADEVELLLGLEPLLESQDARVVKAAATALADVITRQPFNSEPRLRELRQRVLRT